jgi:UDP-glucose 4-epimerase
MVYIGNLCHLLDVIIKKKKSGIFLVSDDEPLSTTRFIELIAQNLDKKVYLIKIPFFESLLKLFRPSFHKRLYGSLEIYNSFTRDTLAFKNLYTVEDGIKFMINGENK